MTAKNIVDLYISFFKDKKHKQIPNASLVPENDPTTLFTSSGMQPLVPYLLGEEHPQGKRLVNVQNCFRAQDIDEIGDNRHTTFFRMLGNWSLGGYFKKEQLPWMYEFLTKDLGLPKEKLYITVFDGYKEIQKDNESVKIWEEIFKENNIDPKGRIFYYGADKNWWSRAGTPDKMPVNEPGGPSSEVFFDFQTPHDTRFGKKCHLNCDCGRYIEICNSVFMEYKKSTDDSLKPLSKKNVDFGGGLERLLAAVENKQDIFQTSLFNPIIKAIEIQTAKKYTTHAKEMRIIADHFISAAFMIANGVTPSNKEQGYILRRLIRRASDNLGSDNIYSILDSIIGTYKETDPQLIENYEFIKNTLYEELQKYTKLLIDVTQFIKSRYKKTGDELKGQIEISARDAFEIYTTHGLSPTQIKSLGLLFNEQEFAEKMKEHQNISRAGANKKFAGGLADHSEKTIMGHTATHLLHQAIRDVLGSKIHQTGSNITTERLRFDFNYDKKLTDEQLRRVEDIVNEKIKENLPVHFEIMPLTEAKNLGAIGLFDEKYQDNVKVYFIGNKKPYSAEFCGGPHVDFTTKLKQVRIIKQENIGHGQRRLYAMVG
ncbi:MAG: alanine--tRNA ligase [Candidatus Levybacteria bacterium]|nr:alanine--tRNA ligase [Candidatus Levybacteria bacterium]